MSDQISKKNIQIFKFNILFSPVFYANPKSKKGHREKKSGEM